MFYNNFFSYFCGLNYYIAKYYFVKYPNLLIINYLIEYYQQLTQVTLSIFCN